METWGDMRPKMQRVFIGTFAKKLRHHEFQNCRKYAPIAAKPPAKSPKSGRFVSPTD